MIDPTSFVEEPLVGIDDAHGPADADDTGLAAASDPGIGVPGDCRLHLVDLRDRPGASGPPPNVEPPGCVNAHEVALSPDGGVASVAATQDRAMPDGIRLELYIVDIERAEVVHTYDGLDGDSCAADATVCGRTEVRALHWADAATVDIVVQDPDPTPDGQIDAGLLVPERLRTITIPIT